MQREALRRNQFVLAIGKKQKSIKFILHMAVGSASDCTSRGGEAESQPGHITLVEMDHEISSVAILPLCP